MTDLPESSRILALAEAGFHPLAAQIAYIKLVMFVKKCEDAAGAYQPQEDARNLLKEIGEDK